MSSGRGRGHIRRRLTLGAAGLAASLLLALVGPGAGPAHAVSGVCAGHKVRVLPFSKGRVEVFKTRGYVCVVLIAKRPGVRKSMSVSVQARGSRAVRDKGRFTHRAGPVTVHAGHRCVRVTGKISGRGVTSGWILC
ncbi:MULTISPECIES: hypothetical protein [Streptomyces]|uniref:Secreted protein n=1 Tax=Streptomyces alfalfae TaxID=1642299 RepID=A0ABM6GWK6_9ACTN|nr:MULTISPECIES: hypothetical protein [Streptomyces]APY88250.1 hypothetical protein A7J05_23455 [Streptomyces alfalfae]KUL52756.1 hypothetical protein ADL30_22615 [Streptomyces sp. NRRL S-1521]